jgi:hypothetical protein
MTRDLKILAYEELLTIGLTVAIVLPGTAAIAIYNILHSVAPLQILQIVTYSAVYLFYGVSAFLIIFLRLFALAMAVFYAGWKELYKKERVEYWTSEVFLVAVSTVIIAVTFAFFPRQTENEYLVLLVIVMASSAVIFFPWAILFYYNKNRDKIAKWFWKTR